MADIKNTTVDGIIEELSGKKIMPNNYEVDNWKSWYRGKVDGFHSYRLFNGQLDMNIEKKSLNMAKTVCEDWADALVNEKLDYTLPDKDKELMQQIFTKNNTNVMLNNAVEKSFATGSGAILVGVKDYSRTMISKTYLAKEKTNISIDYVDVTCMRVLSVERKQITECAFISEATDYTDVSIHLLNKSGHYEITNARINNKSKKITKQDTIDTKSPLKWFFEIRPNINNNSFKYDSLGISIFANAIDVLKAIDDLFDGFSVEYVLLRPRIFVQADTYKIIQDGETGQMKKTIDPYDTVYYLLPKDDENKHKIQAEVPQIRYDAYVNGLNTFLNMLSKKVGFGTERYKFDKGNVATATQIISENSDFARSLKKHEHLFRQVLIDMIWVIKYINNEFTKQAKFSDFKYTDIQIDFDDSIIEDTNAQRERDKNEVQAGLMSNIEYRMKWYNESEEDARKHIFDYFLNVEIEKYVQALKDGVMTPHEFVLRAYGKEDNELEAYITDQLAKSSINPMDLFEEVNKDDKNENESEEEPKEEQTKKDNVEDEKE